MEVGLEKSAELSNTVIGGHWEVGKDGCHVNLLGQTTLNLLKKRDNNKNIIIGGYS